MTIRIDEKRIFEAIEHRKPRSVALNGPEALIPKLQDVADHIAEMFDVQVYIIGDTCWGSCDLNTHAADMLRQTFCSISAIPLQWIPLARRS